IATAHEAHTLEWLALSLTPGLGPTRARRVVEYLGGVAAVFRASLTELEATGILASSAQSLATGKSIELAKEEAERAIAEGVKIVSLEDSSYSAQLKQIYDAPMVLYVRGKSDAISQPGIALVGTRHPTPYGSGLAERLACDLAARGLVIISCMARGVETADYSGTRITGGCAREQNRDVFAVPGNVTNKNSWGANTLIKQGAKLVATWEDVWDDLPAEVRLLLGPATAESPRAGTASLFGDDAELAPHEKKIFALLKADESTHIDELVERLEGEVSLSEIFAALFELELAGKVRQMPGKNFVKVF